MRRRRRLAMDTCHTLNDMRNALAELHEALAGLDTPDLTSQQLEEALHLLRRARVALQPPAASTETSPTAPGDNGMGRGYGEIFPLLAEHTDHVFWYADIARQRMLYINPAFERIWGVPLEEIYADYTVWLDRIHPDDRPDVQWALERWHGGTTETYDIEYRIIRPDGEIHWIGDRGSVIGDCHGKPRKVCGIARDITERRQAEESLRHANQWLELALSAAGAGMWDWDIDSGRFEWSPELFGLFGLDAKTHSPGLESWRGVVHPDDLATETSMLEQALRKGAKYDREYRILLPDGRLRWINARGTTILDTRGHAQRMTGICVDVTDRHGADDSLRRSEDRYRSLVELSPDAVFINLDNRIVFVNPAAVRLFGAASAQQLLGKSPFDLMHPDYHDIVRARTEQQRAGQVVQLIEEKVLRLDGAVIDVEVSAAPLSTEEGTAFQVILRDISDRKRGEQALSAAKEQAEAASRAKSEFLATMSHEIRSPMNGIMGMAQLMEYTELTDEQREYLDVIRTSSHGLLSLINDILDLSKIEAGRLQLERSDFSLRTSINDIVKAHLSQIQGKGLDIRTDIQATAPDNLIGDQLRLKQILVNLLGNAIKFTSRGGIRISVAISERRDDSVRLRIDVTDTGIGIPAEAMERIFKPFTQADSSTTRHYGGTGLGLSICSRLAELMDGRITVESREGAGSTFSVHLPFAVNETAPERRNDSGQRARANWDGPALRILLVDDYEMNLVAVTRLLQRNAHTVVTARDGAEAVQKWEQEHFDAILMDIQMPVMDGMEATRAIRLKEKGSDRHTPIIALTGRAL